MITTNDERKERVEHHREEKKSISVEDAATEFKVEPAFIRGLLNENSHSIFNRNSIHLSYFVYCERGFSSHVVHCQLFYVERVCVNIDKQNQQNLSVDRRM